VTDWSRLVKPSLLGLEPYRPGTSVRELRRAHGLDEVVKLNWNEDLFGPLPGALEAVEQELANVWMYPEQAYADLREAVAGWLGVPAAQVVPAHGIQALIGTVAHVLVRDGDAVVVGKPTYGLYATTCAAMGAEVVEVAVRDHRLDLEAMAGAARERGARAVWVCDPNNPTGSLVARDEWEAFLDALPDGTVVVADEAYAEYADPGLRVRREDDVAAGRPVVLLRTFSKIFGLAGLRLGYAVAAPELAGFLDVVQEPFNVNRAALAAGRACLRDPAAIDERRRENAEARALLTRLLAEAGMGPVPSHANFVLVELGVDDVELAEAMVRRGFLIRAGSEFGMRGWSRITVGPVALMERAASALAEERQALLTRASAR
jgi:histidinol-phosphate aminotransferase